MYPRVPIFRFLNTPLSILLVNFPSVVESVKIVLTIWEQTGVTIVVKTSAVVASLVSVFWTVCDVLGCSINEPVHDVEYEEGYREQISRGAINLLGGYMPLDDEFIHVYWRWMLMFCFILRRCQWFDWFHRRLQDTHTSTLQCSDITSVQAAGRQLRKHTANSAYRLSNECAKLHAKFGSSNAGLLWLTVRYRNA